MEKPYKVLRIILEFNDGSEWTKHITMYSDGTDSFGFGIKAKNDIRKYPLIVFECLNDIKEYEVHKLPIKALQ